MENIEQENYEVSVALLTYMHESYIKQCIDSIISQQTKFKFEIVIGVDFSCDNTLLICKEYEKEYSFIKVLEQSKNIGGCDNLFNIISNCVGKYISLVEGDDFWTAKIDGAICAVSASILLNTSATASHFLHPTAIATVSDCAIDDECRQCNNNYGRSMLQSLMSKTIT